MPALWRLLAGGLAGVLSLAVHAQAPPAQSSPLPSGPDSVILDVRVNGTPQAVSRAMLRDGERILILREELERWRIVPAAGAKAGSGGSELIDPRSIPGLRMALDEATQTLDLDVPAEAFRANQLDAQPERPLLPSKSALGAFVNYDLALQRSASQSTLSGFFDGSVTSDAGLFSQSMLAGNSAFAGRAGNTRLETFFRSDDPARMTRWTVGDSVTPGGGWVAPLRFGGVQFGTRFDLRPDYLSYPTPALHGGAALPSAVEVFVDDLLRYQGRVDAGPFMLRNVPVLTGAGTMRFAVTDALGTSRTVSTPYYVSPNLLREGLSDYSVELGKTRLRYGLRSNDYGPAFASGSLRRGLTDQVTAETHAEAGARTQAAGGGLLFTLAPIGEFSLQGAASRNQDFGTGRLVRASFSRSSGGWTFSALRQVATPGFMQIAWEDSSTHVNRQTQVYAGRSLGRAGVLGASYTVLGYATGERLALVSGSWSVALNERTWLSTFVTRSQQGSQRPVHSIGLSVSIMLGERQSASSSLQRQGASSTASAEVSQNIGADMGVGWRVMAAAGEQARQEASAQWLASHGLLAAEATHWQGESAMRLRASGAAGWSEGLLFAARQTDDAFALVSVPGASAGLKIYRENQLAAETDAHGRAMVPGLRAYEANHLSIEPADLPIEDRLRSDRLEVVPSRRGIARAAFDITRTRSQSLQVRLADGRPLPPGLDLHAEGRSQAPISGFGGQVQIDDPQPGERFEARWRGGGCRFVLPVRTDGNSSSEAITCEPLGPTASTVTRPR